MEPFKPGVQKPDSPQQAAARVPRITWIDKQRVLELMRISERTLQKWRTNGIIPHYNVVGRIYYCEEDLDTVVLAHKRYGTKKGTDEVKK